jgi:hypothetical protein
MSYYYDEETASCVTADQVIGTHHYLRAENVDACGYLFAHAAPALNLPHLGEAAVAGALKGVCLMLVVYAARYVWCMFRKVCRGVANPETQVVAVITLAQWWAAYRLRRHLRRMGHKI